jgi:hypothetical protein
MTSTSAASAATQLTWWEAADLLDHLSSRPDIWTQSNENEHVWFRTTDDDESLQCGIVFIPPADVQSPYRLFHLQEIAYDWTADHTAQYVSWLIANWTTRRHRLDVEKFLCEELSIEPATAFMAAIAIGSFEWTGIRSAEPTTASPTQEEFWPRDTPPRILTDDRTHIGTYLFSGGAGWVRLRLIGGMIRTQISIRARTGEVIPLDGLARPFTSDARGAAAKIAGWPTAPRSEPPDDQILADWEGSIEEGIK